MVRNTFLRREGLFLGRIVYFPGKIPNKEVKGVIYFCIKINNQKYNSYESETKRVFRPFFKCGSLC